MTTFLTYGQLLLRVQTRWALRKMKFVARPTLCFNILIWFQVDVMKSLAAGKYNLLITNKLPGRNKIQHATVLIQWVFVIDLQVSYLTILSSKF